jgi:hypothetical protein
MSGSAVQDDDDECDVADEEREDDVIESAEKTSISAP